MSMQIECSHTWHRQPTHELSSRRADQLNLWPTPTATGRSRTLRRVSASPSGARRFRTGRRDGTASHFPLPRQRSSPPRTPPRKSSTYAAFSRRRGSSSASPRPCTTTTRAPLSCESKDRRSCQRSRHVDRRDLKVRENFAHGHIEVRKIHTDDNVAEVFTKSLPSMVHHKHVNAACAR
eukprot:5778376-Pleurochrysis_carterae.AAC.1